MAKIKPIKVGLGSNKLIVLGDDKKEERLKKAISVAEKICKEKGWDIDNLSMEQLLYLRKFTLPERDKNESTKKEKE